MEEAPITTTSAGARAAALVLAIARETEDDRTVDVDGLNAIAYLAEVWHLRNHARPITGGPYVRQPHGPVLDRLSQIIERLEADGAAKRVERRHGDERQDRLVALGSGPDRLSPTEGEAVREIVRHTGPVGELRKRLESDAGWRAVRDGEVIPLALAFIGRPEVTTEMRARARELAEYLGR